MLLICWEFWKIWSFEVFDIFGHFGQFWTLWTVLDTSLGFCHGWYIFIFFFNFGSCLKDRLWPLGMFFWYVLLTSRDCEWRVSARRDGLEDRLWPLGRGRKGEGKLKDIPGFVRLDVCLTKQNFSQKRASLFVSLWNIHRRCDMRAPNLGEVSSKLWVSLL